MRTHERCSISAQTGAKSQDRSLKSEERRERQYQWADGSEESGQIIEIGREKREAVSVGREERRLRAVAEEQYVKRKWKRSV